MKTRVLLAGATFALGLAGAAQANPLLSDSFNGPTLGSPGAVGDGFAIGPSSHASVSGGLAFVGGAAGAADQNIYSLDTFNPTDTTLTWQVNSRPDIGAAGVMVGWGQPGISECAGCGPEIWLEARDDRTVFDIVDNNGLFRYVSQGPIGGTGPLTMTLSLTATTWAFDITNGVNSIAHNGTFAAGFGIGDVIAASGGNLSTFASVRSDAPSLGDGGSFSSVNVAAVPEPGEWALVLMGFGGLGLALRRRRAVRAA
ncbi:PEP-CTERM sorting domain-containing protein [Phenylobacterium sp.]|uniref:PEP-CTERM sorting domain-containing protein n=1 Tax=Phenylobacterium sp. TaxID=1871053 RepID=UPI002C9FBECC|nr:PEP-CTERM sorting domain-containing protein [Phenylobacterium sp.]HLZ73668.1 PEP-CTERM sorting domain-containing protein [Phenylobacterium sp.]